MVQNTIAELHDVVLGLAAIDERFHRGAWPLTVMRHTCFCEALRSATIALNQWQSSRITLNSCSHDERLNRFG